MKGRNIHLHKRTGEKQNGRMEKEELLWKEDGRTGAKQEK